ncbi:MAG: type II secretion system secretin GspD [Desulfobacterales bacterium]|nr:type II secretion system secretin GspD [Desulfobacterales bacterium]
MTGVIRPMKPIYLLYICLIFFLAVPPCFATQPPLNNAAGGKSVSINFNNVDMIVFIEFISKLTGQNFVVDSRVKGKVTIISPAKLSVKEAYQVFESVLDINGYSTVKSGKVVKITPTPMAKADNLDTRIVTEPGGPGSVNDRIVTRIIPLEYAGSDEIKRLFTPLIPKGSVILSYKDTNMLIITATQSSINRLLKIIEAIDKQSTGKKISVIPIRHADADKLVANLSSVFTARAKTAAGKTASQMNVKLVADTRTNSIILLSSRTEAEKVKQLIDILDKEVPKGDERIRVFYLEHASAEDIVKVLQEIPSQETDKKTPGQKKAPILSSAVKIMADKATNSLVIMADKEDYPILEEVITKLDIPRAMVYIEVLIMEVNFNRGLSIGTEWQAAEPINGDESRAVFGGFGGTGGDGFPNLSGVSGSGSLPRGFSVGVLGKNFNIGGVTFTDIKAVIQAFKNDKDVHILANPQVLTMENEEALINVGKSVPFQTRSTADAGEEIFSSFEYRDVGIILRITPQISKERLVKLKVHQKLEKLDDVNLSSPDRPTTLKREIETTIIVQDSSSVVIGGLIDENLTRTEYKTPCLGDIPVLGWGFKSMSEGEDKTNLYIFLTPRVVKNPLEVNAIYNEKSRDAESLRTREISLYEKLIQNETKGSEEAENESSDTDQPEDSQPLNESTGPE